MVNFDELNGKRICVAVSGGVDSTTLLHYLKAHEKKHGFFLSAVHCEHGIRGEESVEDMRFVERECARLQVPLAVFREDCIQKSKREKCSLETAARNFRKGAFACLIQEGKADFIATAHHQDDEAETLLFRLARGAALSGAGAMQDMQNGIIRPFLQWSRAEIVAYAQEKGVTYREDKTNLEEDATRNKLRLSVLPTLENCVPGARANLARFARLAREDEELLSRLSEELLTQSDNVYIVAFSQEKPLFTRACLKALKGLGVEKDYTSLHLQSVFALQQSERGATLCLPKGVRAEKTTAGIAVYVPKEESYPEKPAQKKFDGEYFDGGRYAVKLETALPEETQYEGVVLRIDKDKLPTNAVFRFRKEGDYVRAFGGGTKSLKKFFNEKKVPVKEREWLPLIASAEGNEVYAVCGVEISDGVKVTANTKNTLYIILQKKKQGE